MIRLINGRGQLGDALRNLVQEDRQEDDSIVYHTWNFFYKSEEVQRKCYENFRRFVDDNSDTKIVFVSTYSETENYYNYYKQLSEAYLLANHGKGYVVKLPTLIGKGIFQKFRDVEVEAFGDMEIMVIEEAAERILEFLRSKSLIRSIRVNGVHVPAKVVKKLVLFGRDGK